VRNNILFGLPFDPMRYDRIVRACALDRDFANFPDGDATAIGERGVTLSGGQRARISLARALYFDADVYLLDDPLSAVDTRVSRILFDQAIRGTDLARFWHQLPRSRLANPRTTLSHKHLSLVLVGVLKDKAVLLITHQLQFARHADRLLVMEQGNIAAVGTYEEVIKRTDLPFAKVLRSYQTQAESSPDNLPLVMVDGAISPDTASVVSASPSVKNGANGGGIGVQQEDRVVGIVTAKTYLDYFRYAGGRGGLWVFVPIFVSVAVKALGNVPRSTLTLLAARSPCGFSWGDTAAHNCHP